MSDYFDPGTGSYIMVGGQIVERDTFRIAERIREYDPDLEILCIDPQMSQINEAPFVICGRKPDGALYRIFECWTLDESVIERIYNADQHRYDALSRVDSMETAAKKLREDRYKETHLELADIVATAVKVSNTKSSFTYKNEEGDKVTIFEDRPPEKGDGRTYSHT